LKQKYLVSLSPETQKLSIREYAELEKGEYVFICEEVHDIGDFRNAMDGGADALIPVVRRPNMYPRKDFSERIAQEIINLLSDESGVTSSEILIDDKDDFIQEEDDIDPRVVYEDEDEVTDLKKDEDTAKESDNTNSK
jgi:hypothetical protein